MESCQKCGIVYTCTRTIDIYGILQEVSMSSFPTSEIIEQQLSRLSEEHFLVLYWATLSEVQKVKYNITNCFDDLKHSGITRTKQTAVAAVEAMRLLCLIDIRDERNRKNIYITKFGAQALKQLVESGNYTTRNSAFLEETKA